MSAVRKPDAGCFAGKGQGRGQGRQGTCDRAPRPHRGRARLDRTAEAVSPGRSATAVDPTRCPAAAASLGGSTAPDNAAGDGKDPDNGPEGAGAISRRHRRHDAFRPFHGWIERHGSAASSRKLRPVPAARTMRVPVTASPSPQPIRKAARPAGRQGTARAGDIPQNPGAKRRPTGPPHRAASHDIGNLLLTALRGSAGHVRRQRPPPKAAPGRRCSSPTGTGLRDGTPPHRSPTAERDRATTPSPRTRLSASIRLFAGWKAIASANIRWPPEPLSFDMTASHLVRDADDETAATESPGLGIGSDRAAVKRHLGDVTVGDGARRLYSSRILGSP